MADNSTSDKRPRRPRITEGAGYTTKDIAPYKVTENESAQQGQSEQPRFF